MAEPKVLEQDVKTGGMLPEVITPASAPMRLEQMSQMIGYMEEFIKSLLKPEVDFGTIPGTQKPTLYKAGAEKLCLAFGLSEEYEIVASERDPFREWEYTVSHYDKKQKRQITETKKTRGYYYFSARCNLIHKGTGVVWASQIGDCESTERGRETAPSNTILKMAQKRAFVGATLHATFTSDRFTADMDTYDQPASKGKPKGKPATPSDGIPNPLRSMKSKYGSEKKPSKCGFCGEYHILEDDPIVQHPGTGKEDDKLEDKWGHADCYAATFGKAEPDKSESEPDESPDPVREDVIKSILELERKVSLEDKAFKIDKARLKALDTVDFAQATNDALVQYLESLRKRVSA